MRKRESPQLRGKAQVTCGHVASVQMLIVELHGQPLFLRHCLFRRHSETHFSLCPGKSPALRMGHRKWRGAQPPRAFLWWRWGRERRPGLARRWSVWRGGYIIGWVPPQVSCWPRPWDCEAGTASLSGPPLGQGHLCREGKGWLRALSRLEEQAGGGDMGGPPTASHLPPGLVILFLFCSSPLLCSLPGVPSEGASGLL